MNEVKKDEYIVVIECALRTNIRMDVSYWRSVKIRLIWFKLLKNVSLFLGFMNGRVILK